MQRKHWYKHGVMSFVRPITDATPSTCCCTCTVPAVWRVA